MAKDQTRRLTPAILTADTDALSVLESITDYAPANTNFTVASGAAAKEVMEKLQQAETQADFAFKTARDNAVAAEWGFHNFLLGAKLQVTAQYGDSSNEMQGLGLKKKTEYKHPSKKAAQTQKG